jgi:hypothetical protein
MYKLFIFIYITGKIRRLYPPPKRLFLENVQTFAQNVHSTSPATAHLAARIGRSTFIAIRWAKSTLRALRNRPPLSQLLRISPP